MDLKECYAKLGGDYEEVASRLRSERIIRKFVLKFLDDKSYQLLVDYLENHNNEEALRAAHTLKGVCQNLSFTRLYESSSQMNNLFKEGRNDEAAAIMPQVTSDYMATCEAIKELQLSEEANG